jgi:hypothetical protein
MEIIWNTIGNMWAIYGPSFSPSLENNSNVGITWVYVGHIWVHSPEIISTLENILSYILISARPCNIYILSLLYEIQCDTK